MYFPQNHQSFISKISDLRADGTLREQQVDMTFPLGSSIVAWRVSSTQQPNSQQSNPQHEDRVIAAAPHLWGCAHMQGNKY